MSGPTGIRNLLSEPAPVRLMGAHDGLTAILVQNYGFEAVWAGGLGICAASGLPDAGLLTMTEMLQAAVVMRRSVDIPIIADVDSGFGDVNVVRRMVQMYEAAAIDGVCIEDKQAPKRNSFRDGNVLEDPHVFARKVMTAKSAQRTDDFLVVVRIESLIAGTGMEDALARARLYCEAGADALLIHSRSQTADEVAEFAARARADGLTLPLFMIPTTYHGVRAAELALLGASAVVYANHPIRAAMKAISQTLESIARHDATAYVESDIATVADLFELVRTGELLDDRPWDGLMDLKTSINT